MSWEDMQYFAATLLVDELMLLERDGGAALLRERVATLNEGERRVLRPRERREGRDPVAGPPPATLRRLRDPASRPTVNRRPHGGC
jgi:hypothetical protein